MRSAGGAAPGRATGSARGRRFTPVRVVLAVGVLAILGAGLAILLQSGPRRAGTNLTSELGFAIPLEPFQEVCEPGELVPGDTGALRLDASTGGRPGPALSARVSGPAAALLSSGRLAAGWREGSVRIPLTRVAHTAPGATICLRNLGPGKVAFAGSVPDSVFQIQLAGKPLGGRMRIEYMRPGSETWLTLLPTLVHRFALAKADVVRHWAAAAVLVLMLLAVALAARTLVREEPSP